MKEEGSKSPPRDPALAKETLRILFGSGLSLAILHGESRIASGDVSSDVDLVSEHQFGVIMENVAASLSEEGIRPIVVWPYDVGATTLFVSNANGTAGAQIDFLWDRTGRGKYGVDARRLLDSAVSGVSYPRVDPLHEQLYLARKRQVKSQWKECMRIVEGLASNPPSETELRRTFVGSVADEVIELLRGNIEPARGRFRRSVAELDRGFKRLRKPVGAWVEVIGVEDAHLVAKAITNRFARILPHAVCGMRPRGGGLSWLLTDVSPVRWKPGLYTSWSANERRPTADLALGTADDMDRSSRQVVDWLERRAMGRLMR